jgi:hypothetical protein
MNQFDSSKDYYQALGCDQGATQREIEVLYKRLAARHHPDRGGTEAAMKLLNEAYAVLRDATARREYDSKRRQPAEVTNVPVSAAPARDIGWQGQGLSALLCLLLGMFLLCLVRFQWIWFLWPLAILAVFVIVFGVLLAHSAMISFNESLKPSHLFRRHKRLQETVFWIIVSGCGFGIYLLFTS